MLSDADGENPATSKFSVTKNYLIRTSPEYSALLSVRPCRSLAALGADPAEAREALERAALGVYTAYGCRVLLVSTLFGMVITLWSWV